MERQEVMLNGQAYKLKWQPKWDGLILSFQDSMAMMKEGEITMELAQVYVI